MELQSVCLLVFDFFNLTQEIILMTLSLVKKIIASFESLNGNKNFKWTIVESK